MNIDLEKSPDLANENKEEYNKKSINPNYYGEIDVPLTDWNVIDHSFKINFKISIDGTKK